MVELLSHGSAHEIVELVEAGNPRFRLVHPFFVCNIEVDHGRCFRSSRILA